MARSAGGRNTPLRITRWSEIPGHVKPLDDIGRRRALRKLQLDLVPVRARRQVLAERREELHRDLQTPLPGASTPDDKLAPSLLERIIKRSAAMCLAPPRLEKCAHVECRLWRIVRRHAPDRTCMSGEASPAQTRRTDTTLDVCHATVHIVAVRRERADRTGGQARPFGAGVAGAGTVVASRKNQMLAKRNRTPVGMPQAEVRMHERSDGRGVRRSSPLRPSDERQPGRTAERKVRGSAQCLRETRDHSPAPSVQGVRCAVVRLFRCRKDGPHPGTRIADDNERRRGIATIERRDRIIRDDMKCPAARESFGFDGRDDGVEVPHRRCVVAGGVLHAIVRREGERRQLRGR